MRVFFCVCVFLEWLLLWLIAWPIDTIKKEGYFLDMSNSCVLIWWCGVMSKRKDISTPSVSKNHFLFEVFVNNYFFSFENDA